MPIRQFRCIVSALVIRSEPRLGDAFKTGQMLRRGDLISAETANRVEAEGYSWLRHERGWSAERSLDGRFAFLSDGVPARERLWGINIDPNNPLANPPAERLFGVGWVRFVFHVDSRRETLEQAFGFYDPIIRAFSQNGTRIILILLQDTYGGNAPWLRGDWATYGRGFAERAGLIARRYRGRVAAYQIWNEPDIQGQPTSIFVAPSDFALMLAPTVRTITQNDPNAQIIMPGIASGLQSGIQWLRGVQSALGGVLPVDGVSAHPYAHVPPGPDSAPFPNWAVGSLDSFLAAFTDAFPRLPVYITEIGVPRVPVEDQSLWPGIARYMDRTIDFLRANYNHAVRAVTWFAWGDSQDQAGIVTDQGRAKGVQYTTFFQNVHADYPPIARPSNTPFDGKVTLIHQTGDPLPDSTLSELAARVGRGAPNIRALILRTSAGTAWQAPISGQFAVSGPVDLARWANEFAPYRVSVNAWHELRGQDAANETNLLVQIARTAGVQSLVLDLNPATLALRTGAAIRNFMVGLRRALPVALSLGLSFDGRPEVYGSLNMSEWLPYIDSWHPKVLVRDYNTTFAALLPRLFEVFRQTRKPVVPMLQLTTEEEARSAARLSMETFEAPGVSFWRLGTADPTLARGVALPWLAGYAPLAPLGTLRVRATTRLNIRSVPSSTLGEVLGQLNPGDMVTVLERRTVSPFEWVRHSQGWSAARNVATGEVFLG